MVAVWRWGIRAKIALRIRRNSTPPIVSMARTELVSQVQAEYRTYSCITTLSTVVVSLHALQYYRTCSSRTARNGVVSPRMQ